MSAIHADAALLNEYPDAIDDEEAFMEALFEKSDEDTDAVKSSDKDKENTTQEPNADETETEETSEETPEEEEVEGDEGGDKDTEETEDQPKAKKFVEVDDDTYVKIKYNGEDLEVKVADLNRLYGQEAALTRKSQEVASAKTQYDEGMAKNIAAYDVLQKQATERANEYRALPWTQLMKDPNVDAGQLAALQAEAQKAFEQEAFLKNEIDGFMKKVAEDQFSARKTAAAECIKQLNDTASPNHIKGWSEALYNDLRTFATEQGVPAQAVNAITDPATIKILHMAMQFKRGASKVVTTKVNKTPTKIVKNTAAAPSSRGSTTKTVVTKQAVAKATKTGSEADAIAAFEAIFGDD
ncbi:hypothetical protein [Bradyrhizobium sp. USDA 4350]